MITIHINTNETYTLDPSDLPINTSFDHFLTFLTTSNVPIPDLLTIAHHYNSQSHNTECRQVLLTCVELSTFSIKYEAYVLLLLISHILNFFETDVRGGASTGRGDMSKDTRDSKDKYITPTYTHPTDTDSLLNKYFKRLEALSLSTHHTTLLSTLKAFYCLHKNKTDTALFLFNNTSTPLTRIGIEISYFLGNTPFNYTHPLLKSLYLYNKKDPYFHISELENLTNKYPLVSNYIYRIREGNSHEDSNRGEYINKSNNSNSHEDSNRSNDSNRGEYSNRSKDINKSNDSNKGEYINKSNDSNRGEDINNNKDIDNNNFIVDKDIDTNNGIIDRDNKYNNLVNNNLQIKDDNPFTEVNNYNTYNLDITITDIYNLIVRNPYKAKAILKSLLNLNISEIFYLLGKIYHLNKELPNALKYYNLSICIDNYIPAKYNTCRIKGEVFNIGNVCDGSRGYIDSGNNAYSTVTGSNIVSLHGNIHPSINLISSPSLQMYLAFTSLKNKNTNLELKNVDIDFYNVCSVIIDEIKGRESVFIKYEKIRNSKYVSKYVVENNIVYHKYKDLVYDNRRGEDKREGDDNNSSIIDNNDIDNDDTSVGATNTLSPLSYLDSALATADECHRDTIMYNRSFFSSKQENINILKKLLKKENKIEYLLRLGYLEEDIEYYKECCSKENVYGFNAMACVYMKDSVSMAKRVLECSSVSLYGCIILGYINLICGSKGSGSSIREDKGRGVNTTLTSNNVALDWFMKGLKYNSKCGYCCLGVGLCLVERGFKKEGIDVLIGCYREVREVSYNLGKIFYDCKEYKESLKWYIKYYRDVILGGGIKGSLEGSLSGSNKISNTNGNNTRFSRSLRDRIIVLALRIAEDNNKDKNIIEELLDGVLGCVGMEEEIVVCKIKLMIDRNELEIKKYLKYLNEENKRRVLEYVEKKRKVNEEERIRVERKIQELEEYRKKRRVGK